MSLVFSILAQRLRYSPFLNLHLPLYTQQIIPPLFPVEQFQFDWEELCARISFNPLRKLQSSNRFYQILRCSIIHKHNMCLIVISCQLASEPHHGFGCRRFILNLNQFVHQNLGHSAITLNMYCLRLVDISCITFD